MVFAPVVSKFRFHNGILYRRVPFDHLSSAYSPATLRQTKNTLIFQPAWNGVVIVSNPRVQIAEGPTFGSVFVDFYDNSVSAAMRQVLCNTVHIDGASCRAVQARNLRPAVRRCAICQRWGHPSQICRSPACSQVSRVRSSP